MKRIKCLYVHIRAKKKLKRETRGDSGQIVCVSLLYINPIKINNSSGFLT